MLIDKVKEMFLQAENKVDRESDAENRYLHLLDKTYKQSCSNQITLRKGPGSWRSILGKLYNFKNTLTEEGMDRDFTFVGMEEGGLARFEDYLTSHAHNKIWKKFLYEHNDTDEFMNDISNIYRRAIYYHKFTRAKENVILFANKRIYKEVVYRILLNKSSFVLDEAEEHLIKYTTQEALTEQKLNDLLNASTSDQKLLTQSR